MTDESLMLDIDIIEKEHEKQLAAQKGELQKQFEEVLTAKDAENEEKDNEIATLKAELEEMRQK